MYKALVFDVDGTLTSKDKIIYLPLLEHLKAIDKKGFKIIFATGNVLPIIYFLHVYLSLNSTIIAENGGVIFHQGKIEIRGDRMEIDKILLQLDPSKYKYLFTDRWRVSEVALTMDSDFDLIYNTFVPRGYRVESSGYAIHIMNKKVSKVEGLKYVLGLLGIPQNEVIAFGDGDNDIELLKSVGTSVCVANGSDKAKQAADFVSTKEGGEGVLEKLIDLKII